MKINYDLRMLETIKQLPGRASLLLHVCCGPCSCNIVKELSQHFDITIYYSNANIYPASEYHRRLEELKTFIQRFNQETRQQITVIEDAYDNQSYTAHLAPYQDTGERGYRCFVCYQMRMKRAYDYASSHHFDYYTTSLSVSPHKNSQWINEIGSQMSEETQFLYADFKKRNGYLKSTQMSADYGMYRQNYCGCLYSYQEMQAREKRPD